MGKKYLFYIIAIGAIITLFTMYKRQRREYQKMLQANYALTNQMKELRQNSQQVTQTMQQVQGRADVMRQEHATFIDQKKYYRVNWKNYIHLSLNDYRTGLFGGIHDLQFTVNNGTEFSIDNLAVQIQYVKADGEVFKTEIVNIAGIPAKASRTAAAPDSRRGTSVKWLLLRMTSQEMNFCYSRDKVVAPGDQDPYQCVAAGPSPH